MCKAAGGHFSFKGDATKKSLPQALYVQAMKTYPVVNEDFDTTNFYFDDPAAFDEDGHLSKYEQMCDLFLEGSLEMRYCKKCYPDRTGAIEEFEQFLKTPFRTRDANLSQDFQKKRGDSKQSFIVMLRQLAIMSNIDWVLHIFSNRHTGRRALDMHNLPIEADSLQHAAQEIKNQIEALHSSLTNTIQTGLQNIKHPQQPFKHLLEAEQSVS
jgi:hypothetical protein